MKTLNCFYTLRDGNSINWTTFYQNLFFGTYKESLNYDFSDKNLQNLINTSHFFIQVKHDVTTYYYSFDLDQNFDSQFEVVYDAFVQELDRYEESSGKSSDEVFYDFFGSKQDMKKEFEEKVSSWLDNLLKIKEHECHFEDDL